MNYKTFSITVISVVTAITIAIGSFIYYIDPLWLFSSSNDYNDVQVAMNERQQKMNHIKFQPFDYDTLLLGSSRSTYINQHDFEGMNVYNFAVSNMSVREYNAFIDFAKKKRGKEFDTIIIGLDFFKSSVDQSNVAGSLAGYEQQISDPLFRVKSFFSWDTLQYAIDNFKISYKDTPIYMRNYNRENVAVAKVDDIETIKRETSTKIDKFKEVFYGKTYQYNKEYPNYLQALVDNNPNTKFIIFTTPISTPLFEALVEMDRLDDYNKWLKDVVSVFGEVHNYMYPNSVTNDISNYFDGHHFYPKVGTLIAKSISGVPLKDHSDFGQVVNSKNINEHLEMVKKLSEQSYEGILE
ncbi:MULTISPECIES: hypothetical protein [Bacillus]|uniref:hypothetical protein n=1 Tax=Bacillus TaxID=1386 RepID=UPI000306C197|nr:MULTISPECIES: hypothetical protein [Bacillus]